MGLFISGYGIKTIITEELVAEGSRLRGMGWYMYGDNAIIGGCIILAFGFYFIYLAYTLKE